MSRRAKGKKPMKDVKRPGFKSLFGHAFGQFLECRVSSFWGFVAWGCLTKTDKDRLFCSLSFTFQICFFFFDPVVLFDFGSVVERRAEEIYRLWFGGLCDAGRRVAGGHGRAGWRTTSRGFDCFPRRKEEEPRLLSLEGHGASERSLLHQRCHELRRGELHGGGQWVLQGMDLQ